MCSELPVCAELQGRKGRRVLEGFAGSDEKEKGIIFSKE